MSMNIRLIETKTIGSGGAASIEFTSIPQTYTDLYLVCSLRSNDINANGGGAAYIGFNTYGTAPTNRAIRGQGSGTPASFTNNQFVIESSDFTASTFGNMSVYIPNYSSTTIVKSFSIDSVNENSATFAEAQLNAQLWNSTSAITSIKFTPNSGSFVQHSSISLYGISSVTSTLKATGGIVSEDNTYYYHTFPFSSIFTPTESITAQVLVIAAGAGGRRGGGGAGGISYHSSKSLTANQSYTVTIGAGGSGGRSGNAEVAAANGGNSVFDTITSVGGGAGGASDGNGFSGGCGGGGGGGGGSTVYSGGSSTQTNSGGATGYGNAGGTGTYYYHCGGGGGAGTVGSNSTYGQSPNGAAGNGGNGLNTWSLWAYATNTGVNGYYAGGAAGYNQGAVAAAGGLGGGAVIFANGITNTGSGGGPGAYSSNGGTGGSGLVIVRYAK